MSENPITDALIIAREMIDAPHKWGKGKHRKCPCAGDALKAASDQRCLTMEYSPMRTYLHIHTYHGFRSVMPKDYEHIAGYNDDPNTTHQMLMDTFDKAIEKSKHEKE